MFPIIDLDIRDLTEVKADMPTFTWTGIYAHNPEEIFLNWHLRP